MKKSVKLGDHRPRAALLRRMFGADRDSHVTRSSAFSSGAGGLGVGLGEGDPSAGLASSPPRVFHHRCLFEPKARGRNGSSGRETCYHDNYDEFIACSVFCVLYVSNF